MDNNNEMRLITSALPYVNNIPHLGNLVQMLSADVFARYCRSAGYRTLCICGTDEYGTATETKALEEHKTPRELCDYYYVEHKKIYDWFNIKFDKFGRTSNSECTQVTQSLFNDLDQNGYITEHESEQLFCQKCDRFLADRYVVGKCPKCGAEAKGDQCDSCGALLSPIELKEPKCTVCGGVPVAKKTRHLYLNLPKMAGMLDEWMQKASSEGKWASNAVMLTKAWIRDGLRERAITRDLKWGIDVPRAGYDGKDGSPKKVFYVWFNASIGYISITQQLANELNAAGKPSFDWQEWWLPSDASKVKLFQFIGKDNIPFHTVIFPCTLLGSGKPWTKLFHISSTEYLNYEDTKFSKSRGVGVFGNDAIESGIPADAWRFYIFYNRPEKQDFQFQWKDFQEKLNSELVGNLGNLVNRTLTFVTKYYDGTIPSTQVAKGAQSTQDKQVAQSTQSEQNTNPQDIQSTTQGSTFWQQIRKMEGEVKENFEWANLKDAFRGIFAIADVCNKEFQDTAPWKTRTTDPDKAAALIHNLCYVIKDLMIMAHPFMPDYTATILSYFGKTIEERLVGEPVSPGLNWSDVGKISGLDKVLPSKVYFTPMDTKTMESYRLKYSGTQQHAQSSKNSTSSKAASSKSPSSNSPKKAAAPSEALPQNEQPDFFAKNIRLRVAKITHIERNPQSDKLYIETLDDGSGEPRTIQSGLVPYLQEDELLGKSIILVDNLSPRKMRGVTSRGMLLAADYKDATGKDCVEVLTTQAEPGSEVILAGQSENAPKPASINADDFFKVQIRVVDNTVKIAGQPLLCKGVPLTTKFANNAEVG